jgi:hypothetical protein
MARCSRTVNPGIARNDFPRGRESKFSLHADSFQVYR